MILNTYKKYILNSFSKILIEIILIFFSLILIINLFEEITFLKNIKVSGLYPFLLAFLNTPSIIIDILPFVFLISTQLFFIKISNKNELFVFKYSGLTNNKILGLLVIFSFFLGILIIFSFYSFSSKLKGHYLEIKNSFSNDNKYLAVITENGFWIKDEINEIISITNADKIDNHILKNVSIVQFDKNFELIQSLDSQEVNIKTKNWLLKNVIVSKNNVSKQKEFFRLESNFDIEKVNKLFSNLSSMSIFQLNKLKKDYLSLGYSTVDIQIYQNKIYSLPVYLAIMTLISGIIMFNSKYKKSKIFNIVLGIFLSVIIFYINQFSSLLGSNGKIPIILSVWLPLVILILISLIGLVRLNEK
ncbi:LptF/LptG family permease [Candidatus Pelagibacter sp.]|nr:LptF/LptG family permease [Candidatus Pelagibacter sp.]